MFAANWTKSLQIYLDSVKWKIFDTWVTKHFQGVKKWAKWGQNANYGKFHDGNGIYSLQVEQNRYISSLQINLDSVKWKIFVTWVTKHFQGVQKGAKWGQNANYRQFHYGNAIYSLQVEQNRYISSLQIYLDNVKWKTFVTGVTKHFQEVKKGAKWGQNAIIDKFTTVMPYIRCKLNKIVIYRNYRYTWTVWNEKYSLLE